MPTYLLHEVLHEDSEALSICFLGRITSYDALDERLKTLNIV